MHTNLAVSSQSDTLPATAPPGLTRPPSSACETMQATSIAASPPGPEAPAAAAAADAGACATAGEALGVARGLLHQLRASHAEAAAAADAHRREREALLHQLQAIQVGGAG